MVEFLIFEILFLIEFYFNKEFFGVKIMFTLLIIFHIEIFCLPFSPYGTGFLQ